MIPDTPRCLGAERAERPFALKIARTAFYLACDQLPPDGDTPTVRALLAEAILAGEHDLGRLRVCSKSEGLTWPGVM